MRKIKIILLGLFCLWVFQGVSYSENIPDKIKVIASTTLIASILQEVGADRVEVTTIIPAGMCPGHFDIRPADVRALEEARLILKHGFEGEVFVKGILKLIKNSELQKIVLNIKGSWMVPEVYIQAIDKIAQILSQAEPESGGFFKSRARDYKKEVIQAASEIQKKSGELRTDKFKVVCAQMQAEFLDWLGFGIAATYGRPEDFSPRQLKEVIKKAKEENAQLVVDNLQGGSRAGIPIAEELGITHIVLTNFPEPEEGKLSFLRALNGNAGKLFKAIQD